MAYRDSKGRFLPGNPYRFRQGEERTILAAKKGFKRVTELVFEGHKGKAMEWLGLCLLKQSGHIQEW